MLHLRVWVFALHHLGQERAGRRRRDETVVEVLRNTLVDIGAAVLEGDVETFLPLIVTDRSESGRRDRLHFWERHLVDPLSWYAGLDSNQ
jgi:hypothetical protein